MKYVHIGYPLNGVGAGIGSTEEVKENKKVLFCNFRNS